MLSPLIRFQNLVIVLDAITLIPLFKLVKHTLYIFKHKENKLELINERLYKNESKMKSK